MLRELTALWSLGTLLLAPVTPLRIQPPVIPENLHSVLPLTVRTVVTSDMKAQFDECLREMAEQIKEQFADEVVAYHPIFKTPIRVSDSRVTIDKIVAKLQQKTRLYAAQGGGVEINITWDSQRRNWALSGYLLRWKDSKTGKMCRQYAQSLHELRSIVCIEKR